MTTPISGEPEPQDELQAGGGIRLSMDPSTGETVTERRVRRVRARVDDTSELHLAHESDEDMPNMRTDAGGIMLHEMTVPLHPQEQPPPVLEARELRPRRQVRRRLGPAPTLTQLPLPLEEPHFPPQENPPPVLEMRALRPGRQSRRRLGPTPTPALPPAQPTVLPSDQPPAQPHAQPPAQAHVLPSTQPPVLPPDQPPAQLPAQPPALAHIQPPPQPPVLPPPQSPGQPHAQLPLIDILGPVPEVTFGHATKPSSDTLRMAARSLGILISHEDISETGITSSLLSIISDVFIFTNVSPRYSEQWSGES